MASFISICDEGGKGKRKIEEAYLFVDDAEGNGKMRRSSPFRLVSHFNDVYEHTLLTGRLVKAQITDQLTGFELVSLDLGFKCDLSTLF